MRDRISEAIWDRSQLPRLLEALGTRAGLGPSVGRVIQPPAQGDDDGAWFESAAAAMGLETMAIEMRGFRLRQALREAAPAIVPLQGGALALLDLGTARTTLLKPDLSTIPVTMDELCRQLRREAEEPFRDEVEKLTAECGIAPGRQRKAVEALLQERTRYRRIAVAYALRRPPGADFAVTAQTAGLRRDAVLLLVSHLAEYALWMGSWGVLGRGVLQGRIDTGVLSAWALMLASLLPFRIGAAWLQGRVAIGFGGLLRERLLDGALKLKPDEVRRQGAGAFLGQAIEAEQLETMAISGGVLAALTLVELLLSFLVLLLASRDWVAAAVLAVWVCIAAALSRRYFRLRTEWTQLRLAMTGDVIETMTGHRTRLAQQPPEQWHEDEDRATAQYLEASRRMDAAHAWMMGAAPRGYLVTSLISLTPEFLSPNPATTKLAISLGAMIIAWQAFRRLSGGLAQLAGAGVSWRSVRDLFHAAARQEDAGAAVSAPKQADTVLTARELTYRYANNGQPVFESVNLEVRAGDWLLLEGASGGGKSTLVSVLAGLRKPSGGLVLAGGLDPQTLGARLWRSRIAAAPQYHENHVLGNTFGFNLLMGRGWPATEKDMQEAEQICRELGLGPLLERMPSGLFQMVGETGWQLSQGERSRLFLARALLQNPELVVLDESFAALDPENLRQALECTLRRAKTVLVVAHP